MSNSLPSTNNSLTQFLQQLLRIQKNSMEIVGKLNDVTISNAQTIVIEQESQDGTVKTYEVPSIGFLKNQISRLDTNFNTLSGLDGGDVTVRMPDGSFKKIVQSTLFKTPSTIGQLLVPSKFNRKNNWFFESFLNPLLYVSFDITQYVEYNTQQVFYKRLIVNCDTDEKKTYFDQSLKGRNDISYDTLLSDLFNRQISYFVDEDIANLPVSIPRYGGSFDVISYTDETVPVTQPNGTIINSKVRKFFLNTLKYTDNLQNFKDTLILKPGDKLDVGQATKYEVVTVDTSTNSIVLKMTSGTETIPIGSGVLRISMEAFAIKEVQINIGFDERQVLFIKAIDKDTNITTRDFSPGVGIFTNELVIDVPAGQVTLEKFYKEEVMDFGASILTLAKEGAIPAIYGEKPDPPRLVDSNFKVVLLNSQKFDTDVIDNLKKKISQKNTVATEITQLESSIEKKKQELNISKFNSDAEKRGVQNQLESLIREKTSKSNLYASIIKDLSTTAKNLPPELANPKYRTRGFFPIPQAKPSVKTLDQEVIAFIISYRYLKNDGTAPGTDQLDFRDNNGETVRGYFSNWNEFETKIRQKVYDPALGIYVWKKENVQDADAININQIDIPITSGERVEIRVKSLSEAGWPTNPLESDWSTSIVIPFPDNLSADEEILTSLNASLSEETRVNFNQDLAARGLDLHLSTSFVQKDKYYAHPSDSISSGFFDSAGNSIDLYNKLKELDTRIAELKATIEKAKGKLQVYIVDPSGEKYLVSNNSLVDLFAGYYSNVVAALPAANQKGAIVTSIYKLLIENVAVSTLQLASSFPGGLDEGLPISLGNFDADYAKRRYDIVPITLSSLQADKTANSKAFQISPFQSAQQLSQYIYSRYTDIGLKTAIYGSLSGSGGPIQNNTLYPVLTGTVASSFIWDGTYTGTSPSAVPDGSGFESPFAIHTLHPDINTGVGATIGDLNFPIGASSASPAVYPKILQAAFFNKDTADPNGLIQAQYYPTDLTGLTAQERYPIKLGFYANDRYLIGSDTCGSYLYLAPAGYADLLVDGTDYRATRNIEFGEANQIVIPIIYQFRMTDFFGSGINGTGRIGGYAVQPKNLVYTKKIGIDINVKEETLFSFDVQITSKYKVDSPSQTAISPAKNTKLSPKQTESLKKIF
jgi:hypothetical protein